MINHLRTLLLNLPALDGAPGTEDYIPPGFVPRVLNDKQSTVHRAVFGASFPRSYRAFVATILARLVDASPLKQEIDRIDRRRFLSEPKSTDIEPSVLLYDLEKASAFTTVGVISGNPVSGVFSNLWEIERESAGSIRIRDTNLGTSRVEQVTFDASGDLIRLEPGSPLFVRFVGVSEIPAGFKAKVLSRAPMRYDIHECLDRLKTSRVRDLFDTTGDQELSRKLRHYFDGQERVDWSVAAALVAYTLSFQ